MLAIFNAYPGLSAFIAAIILGAMLLVVLLLLEHSRDGKRRRERRILIERMQRELHAQEKSIALLNQSLTASAQQITELSTAMEQRQDRMRTTLDIRLEALQRSNEKKLDQMRETVSEKLESTLEGRLGESFRLVNEQLAQVHQGLGEMQGLAANVGDLKKVLTNVKTRGVWGEVRLRALLEQTLAPGQFLENVQADPATQERVEFALRLPAVDGEGPLLPIDSKFPQEDYLRLINASEAGDAAEVEKCAQQLERAVLEQAKRISEKYIRPPRTTDFAILFLPVESLYAEVLRRPGLTERIQIRHRVMIAGPATLNALLTSLQLSFRTCALQQRSSEVLQLLTSVRSEFNRFGEAVQKARQRLELAEGDLDALDTRARAINKQLKNIGEE